MTTVYRDAGVEMSRCRTCDHDLFVRRDGKVHCSNGTCRYARVAHPTGNGLNAGKVRR